MIASLLQTRNQARYFFLEFFFCAYDQMNTNINLNLLRHLKKYLPANETEMSRGKKLSRKARYTGIGSLVSVPVEHFHNS